MQFNVIVKMIWVSNIVKYLKKERSEDSFTKYLTSHVDVTWNGNINILICPNKAIIIEIRSEF